jgi:hypothetical protein
MPSEDLPPQDAEPWGHRYTSVTYEFATQCAKLRDAYPYDDAAALDAIMVYLATELWDRGFSQSEIKASFETAIDLLKPYCAGEERREDRDRPSSPN